MPAEQSYYGIGVSPGVAIGDAHLFRQETTAVPQRTIAPEQVEAEYARFLEALGASREQIASVRERVAREIGEEQAKIFDFQIHIINDTHLTGEVKERLGARLQNVEIVFTESMERYIQLLTDIDDELFRERRSDLRDVRDRILTNLAERRPRGIDGLPFASIVVAHDIAPSDAAMMEHGKVLAFATDLGGRTSHTAIISASMGIPAVVGLHDLSLKVRSGDPLIVDGNRGIVVVNPAEETVQRYSREMFRLKAFEDELTEIRDQPAVTTDGHRVVLSANIEVPEEINNVRANGAEGVGLYRTEFLYMSRDELPSEDEQYDAYKTILEGLAPNPVIIRTFDLGGDKFVSHLDIPFELNPFLGWRAIRFCLERTDIFKTQLRAIVRASVHGNLKLMYPMISSVDEVITANAILDEAKEELLRENVPFNESFEVGVMIEVPSAAMTADIIARHVDFFSIGTNDLIQYTLAVERTNDRIAHLYKPCHPGVLRLVKMTIDAGHEHDIWVGMCGEMAAEPATAMLLVGMGIDELSMSAIAVPKIKKVIRSISYADVVDFARDALTYHRADKISEMATERLRDVLPALYEQPS
jgi:phosphotransferase system enzyme I (PtsI)